MLVRMRINAIRRVFDVTNMRPKNVKMVVKAPTELKNLRANSFEHFLVLIK